jgi:ADP-ribose pyrophosphatase YjhB (NUDIX family)
MVDFAGWSRCPRCGAQAAIEGNRLDCAACGLVVYANPAPTANVLLLDDDGRVLLARRAREPYLGYWDVPGGFLDAGEDAEEGLRRELREEAGVEIELTGFVGGFADRYHGSTVNFLWTGRIASGDPVPGDDVAELRWFPRDGLPDDGELAFTCVARMLAAWRAAGAAY